MKSEATELSVLFEHARHGDEPSEDDRRRVTSRVAERLALGAGLGVATFTLSRYAWAASLKTWGIAVVALAGVGSAAYVLSAPSQRPLEPTVSRPAPVKPSSVKPAPIVVAPPALAPEPALAAPAPLVHHERPSAAPSSAAPAAALEPGKLARETAALRAANEALRSGSAARSLSLLDAFAKEFPGGVLTEEALATRVSALCALGRVGEARAVGTRFVQRYPRSPVAARVRGSCAMPKE